MTLHTRFQALDALLHTHEAFWKPVPFHLPVLPWQAQQPELTHALRALSDEQLAQLEADSVALLAWLSAYLPDIAALDALTAMDALPAQDSDYPSRFAHDIPGRKWQQVTAFAAAMPPAHGPILEWCAGKAHLGRALHYRFRQPITSLEWDAALCRDGNALSQQHRCDVEVHDCDVLSAAVMPFVERTNHAVALHACGDLHRRLIALGVQHGITSLQLSPCCYHLTAYEHYRPFSHAAADSRLRLDRDDLRLAVQETVTAPAITTARRQKKNAWRLGFDALQRELRGRDDYLPVPPIADALLQSDFAHFCRHAATLKGLDLPDGVDFSVFEAKGWQRHHEVVRMELVRHAFRRALELWLVLDYALYFIDSGYRVTLGTFCERELTPRNLLLSVRRHA